jgi:hypothetical protein
MRVSVPLLSGAVGDDVRFHDTVAGIEHCGQCVRVGRNVGPEISHLRRLAVDHFLVIINERVAFPMRGAPQLATGINWRLEAGKKPITLHLRVPPDRDEPVQLSSDRANGMAFRHQRGPTASQPNVCGPAATCAFRDGLTVLHDLHCVPISRERVSKAGHLGAGSQAGGLGLQGREEKSSSAKQPEDDPI